MTFDGVYSVLPTPFTDSGELDERSLGNVVNLFIDKGVNGLTALGVTGEVARLEERERSRVLKVASTVAGSGGAAGTDAGVRMPVASRRSSSRRRTSATWAFLCWRSKRAARRRTSARPL